MAVRNEHRFTYTGKAIAGSLGQLIDEAADELDREEKKLNEVRAELCAEIYEAIARRRARDSFIYGPATERTERTQLQLRADPAGDQVSVVIDNDLHFRYDRQQTKVGQLRAKVGEYLEARGRYDAAADENFVLDSDDVAYFGLA